MKSQDLQKLLNIDESKIKEEKTEALLEESKANPSSNPIIEITPPKLLAWCSRVNNKISIMDLETKQEFANFDGAKNQQYILQLDSCERDPKYEITGFTSPKFGKSANLEIFDISNKAQAKKIYSLGEISGVVGWGDVTYNVRRHILGTISVEKQIAYHLFSIEASTSNVNEIVKVNRKSKWHPQYSDSFRNIITGFDFNPTGETVATIDRYGVCLISNVNTACYSLDFDMGQEDLYGRCRWSSNTNEPLLYIKYNKSILKIMDIEKKARTLMFPVQLEKADYGYTYWIDVCQFNGNLLASGGSERIIKIFDKRESKIVKTFDRIHSNQINCVRWSPSGDMLASASHDKTVKLLDFKTGKIIHTGNTSDGYAARSVCFI